MIQRAALLPSVFAALLLLTPLGQLLPPAAADERPSAQALRRAVERAIPQLQSGAAGSAAERQCYTCHSQGLPVFALSAAAARGLAIDHEIFEQQVQHTWAHLQRGQSAYQSGKGQGGQVLTAGYALWTLEAGGHQPDAVTHDVVHYLIHRQADKPQWTGGGQRPPSSGSSFTTTYVALRGMQQFGSHDQTDAIARRRQAAAQWILDTQPNDTEDRVFQLRCLPYIAADAARIDGCVQELLALQASDGGWGQTSDMPSDAYATGSVLAALHEAGGLTAEHPAYVRGLQYLLKTQLPDGTWHVVTRAKPIQDYFESDFPHGDDQFISIAATGWATLALVYALPTEPPTPPSLTVKRCQDFEVDGRGTAAAWQSTEWITLHRRPGAVHDYSARFKLLYSPRGMYVLFDGSDQRLTATLDADFLDLWTEDVYECFFWPDERQPLYFEYEISPLGYELPILIPNLDGKFLGWRPWHYAGERKVHKQVSATGGSNTPGGRVTRWSAEVFIPFELLKPLQNVPPQPGSRWRANFYRVDYDPLAASPSAPTPAEGDANTDADADADASQVDSVTQWDWSRVGPSFHEYQRFGELIFE